MILLKGLIAALIWSMVGIYFQSKGFNVSNDIQILSTAIVVAGALASGSE